MLFIDIWKGVQRILETVIENCCAITLYTVNRLSHVNFLYESRTWYQNVHKRHVTTELGVIGGRIWAREVDSVF